MRWLHVVVLGVAFGLTSCTSQERATKTLSAYGFFDISTGGWQPFACDRDTLTATRFTARNSAGLQVSGVVCCNPWNTCEVRF